MVTGTTASVCDQIIMTGKAGSPQALASSPRNSVWPGKSEAGLVERRLGDRIGDDGAGLARRAPPRPRARSTRSSLRRCAATGRPGSASTGFSSGTTGRPLAKIAAASRGSVSTIGASKPMRLAMPERCAGAASDDRRARRQATSTPGGERQFRADPCRLAHRHRKRRLPVGQGMRSVRDGPEASEADVRLDVAQRPQNELEHQRLVADRRIVDHRPAGIDGIGGRRAEAG